VATSLHRVGRWAFVHRKEVHTLWVLLVIVMVSPSTASPPLRVRNHLRVLESERLFCEPNAFNVAPNRTLQRAGFHYLFTHEARPRPINFPQMTARSVLDRPEYIRPMPDEG
jgi:hypothetical protein